MSKFNRLIATFRNGLVSPRIRGTVVEPTDSSSAEVLDNFLVERTGAIVKRPGSQLIIRDTNTSSLKRYLSLEFLGVKTLFQLDRSLMFNSVDGSYNSTFLKDISGFIPVKTFGTGVANSATDATDMFLWNGRHSVAGNYIDSGLTNYLSVTPTILQYKKVSDRTYVFTTNTFSFLLSLLDKPDTNNTIRQFYLYPYFVSSIALINTLNKNIPASASCPISPSNFPFNEINTDTSLTISCGEVLEGLNVQTGVSNVLGVVAKSNQRIVWNVTLPKTMLFLNGSPLKLEGRFLRLPTSDASKDTVFFLTRQGSVGGGSTVVYTAIQVIGGTPLASTSLWRLSTWGNESHPKVVGYCFKRLMYANIKTSPSQWWASAIHIVNPLYFQGFLSLNLPQDSNSDFSGINYQGATSPLASDIFRFGFTDKNGTLGEIAFISSRRRIHFGTSKGEVQLQIDNGVYDRSSYSQFIMGSNAATVPVFQETMETEGDRKIFYISNNNKDIRAISTEDKDYESLDVLVSITLDGQDTRFTKIQWIEEFNCIFCLSYDPASGLNRMFALSMHSDSQIRAFSEIKFKKNIEDFSGKYVLLKDTITQYSYVAEVCSTPYVGSVFTPVNTIYSDLFSIVNPNYDFPNDALGGFENFPGETVYIYDGVTLQAYDVPLDGIVTTNMLPEITPTFNYGQIYIYTDKLLAKYKSTPIHEGAKFGSSVGDVQRVDRVGVLVDSSGKFKYGSESDKLIEVEGFNGVEFFKPITKIVNLDFPQSPDIEQFIHIESDDPTPLNISGISLRGVSYSGE